MLLTPTAGETEAAFVARFMADEDMIAEYPDEKQRAAVAYKQAGAKLAGEAKGIEILRAGDFTGMGGVKVKITDADLDAIAANFADHPDVPMVLGHEENSPVFQKNIPTDTPAAGWASKVYVAATDKGKRLLADVGSIPDLVGAWVNSKVYRKVSAMLMRGEKGMYLGHIGLLGARAPAVRGLKDFPLVSFADQGNGVLVVTEVGGSPERRVNVDRAAAVNKLKELGADPVLFAESVPDAVVIKLAECLSAKEVEVKTAQDAQKAAEAKLAAGDGDDGDTSEAVKTLNKARDEANAAIAALAAANKASRVSRVETVFSTAVKEGRMAPAEMAAMKPAALALADQDGIVVELASGTGTKKVSALEALLLSVEARPKHVMFAEGAEDPEKATSDSRKDEIVRLAESQYAEVPALRKAYPDKKVFVENQLLAAGIKVEPAKK